MIRHGDCLEVMPTLPAESIDAVVTDPPYGLGFMGKHWDHGVPAIEFWSAMLRVAKPSAYLLAFGGTRTVHRMACAIEDAGWIIRDMLVWGYASGFPKSKASLKPAWEPIVMARKPGPLRMLAIDECRIGVEPMPHIPGELGANGVYGRMVRSVSGPTAIMDAWDDERNLCGSCAADADSPARPGARATRASTTPRHVGLTLNDWATSTDTDRPDTGCSDGTMADDTATSSSIAASGRTRTARSPKATSSTISTATGETTGSRTCRSCGATSTGTTTTDGTTSTRNGLPDGTTSADTALGRWPSNLVLTDPIFDGGWEGVVGGGETTVNAPGRQSYAESSGYGGGWGDRVPFGYDVTGTYSRFFLVPKADRADREPVLGGLPVEREGTNGTNRPMRVCVECGRMKGGAPGNCQCGPTAIVEKPLHPRANVHPTVKPTELMRHLVRLVTPAGGVVLDPFLGSGSTGLAAELEGFEWIGIEKEAEYVAIAEARLNGTQRGMAL